MILHLYSDNDFVAILELPEGEHEYKFNIDGRWEYDLNEVIISTYTLSLLISIFLFLAIKRRWS
jgi:hypothetical protein